MIFQALIESAGKGELILINGGFCRWHFRKNKQITILEIISLKKGAGSQLLGVLKFRARELKATSLFCKCPVSLPANDWYLRKGFIKEKKEILKNGTEVNHWRYRL